MIMLAIQSTGISCFNKSKISSQRDTPVGRYKDLGCISLLRVRCM